MRNVWIVAVGLGLLSGCGPAPPTQQELGKIVFSFDAIPGFEEAMQAPIPAPRASPKPDDTNKPDASNQEELH